MHCDVSQIPLAPTNKGSTGGRFRLMFFPQLLNVNKDTSDDALHLRVTKNMDRSMVSASRTD